MSKYTTYWYSGLAEGHILPAPGHSHHVGLAARLGSSDTVMLALLKGKKRQSELTWLVSPGGQAGKSSPLTYV
jgi:hypothetical protein